MVRGEERTRLIWLLIVLCVAFAWPIAKSTYLLFHPSYGLNDHVNLRFGVSVLFEAAGIGLLWASLKLQRRSLKEIGFTFRPADIGHALFIYFIIYILDTVVVLLVPNFRSTPNNIDFLRSGVTIYYFLFIIVNPIFEELIVRAYGITEFLHFFKKEEVTVLISTLIQTSYHLYQGIIPAMMNGILFLVFSIYFAKKKRIVPIIIVHEFFDLYSMIRYSGSG